MEEIIIEEKKYISSKRAAKTTGYAKDYIGQLCREGRVPARLVGRSWYVLESAIQDHRFGTEENESKDKVTESFSSQSEDFPRYESSHPTVLPSLNRLNKSEEVASVPEEVQITDRGASKTPQDSWKEWFDHVSESIPAVSVPIVVAADHTASTERQEDIEEAAQSEPIEAILENVTLRVVKQDIYDEEPITMKAQKMETRGSALAIRVFQLVGLMIIVVSVAIASVGSGYFDNYLVSVRQAQVVSGISVYNK
ncbi:MAG: hypothetical protein WCW36_02845 [Candidatus Paceibacterota bacterium]|jgi:hypothetical protein